MDKRHTGQSRTRAFSFIKKESAISSARVLIQIKANYSPGLIQIKAVSGDARTRRDMWMDISTAPLDRRIGLAVVDGEGLHPLVVPCRRVAGGFIDAVTGRRLDVRPTHWREWTETTSPASIPAR